MAVSIIQNYGSNNNPANAPFSGPLAALYNNRYAFEALQYPRDLGTTYKGHIVKFDVYKVKPYTLTEISNYVGNKLNATSDALGKAYEQAKAVASDPAKAVVNGVDYATQQLSQQYDAAKNLAQDFQNAGGLAGVADQMVNGIKSNYGQFISGNLTDARIQIEPRNEKIDKSISLYMPDTVDFSYEANYNTASLGNIAGSLPLVGGIIKAVTSGESATGEAMRLALNAAGYVFNPQQQMLFEGIGFRAYNMNFVFTPSSAQEAENVKNIIQTFRQYAAPTVVRGLAGFFFNPPGMFDVSFLYNGQQNTKLNKIKKSVITSVDVNYAPNGWAAHEDGAPVQTTLTLQFQEMSLTDSSDIANGY